VAEEFAGCGIDGFDGHACEGPWLVRC
jgi:hypothetical protein